MVLEFWESLEFASRIWERVLYISLHISRAFQLLCEFDLDYTESGVHTYIISRASHL